MQDAKNNIFHPTYLSIPLNPFNPSIVSRILVTEFAELDLFRRFEFGFGICRCWEELLLLSREVGGGAIDDAKDEERDVDVSAKDEEVDVLEIVGTSVGVDVVGVGRNLNMQKMGY